MKKFISVLAVLICGLTAFSQQVSLSYSGSKSYSLVERTNLRRYENGKYIGLTSREVRSFINPTENNVYDGNFYVVEKTLRDMQSAFAGIYDAIPSVFTISSDGKMQMIEDNGYPSFRSFPSFPVKPVRSGDSWSSQAERSVDPLNKGKFTKLKIDVLYKFIGEEIYREQNVYRIKAIWQTNYGMNWRDPNGDSSLIKALGGHKADILVLKSNGSPILVIDDVDETFMYSDGKQENFKGRINLFIEFPPAVDRGKILPALGEIASISEVFADDLELDSKSDKIGDRTNDRTDKKIEVSKLDADFNSKSDIQNKNNEEQIQKHLEVLEQIEKSKAEKIEQKKRETFEKPEKISEEDLLEDNLILSGKEIAKKNEQEKIPEEKISENKPVEQEKIDVSKFDSILKDVSGEKEEPKNNMVVEKTSAGIRLSVRNLQFKPDSSELIDSEKKRLDEIAKVLKLASGSKFLIEGHTARVGDETGEQELSEERAKVVAQELSKRGVSADSFICKGYGGTKPIASNQTSKGMAQNRRVEITILE